METELRSNKHVAKTSHNFILDSVPMKEAGKSKQTKDVSAERATEISKLNNKKKNIQKNKYSS